MNVTDHSPLLESLRLQEELQTTLDDRTLQILDRRQRTAVVKRRGWLVRRMLLAADVVGLLSALLLAELLAPAVDERRRLLAADWKFSPSCSRSRRGWSSRSSTASTTATTSAPITRPPTTSAASSTWSRSARGSSSWSRTSTDIAHPTASKLVVFWAAAIAFVCIARAGARTLARRSDGLHPEHRHRRRGRRRAAVREEAPEPPGVRDQPRRLRRRQAEGAPRGPRRYWRCSATRSDSPAIVRLLDVERVIVAFSNDSHEETLDLLRALKDLDVQIDIVPRLFEFVGPGVEIHTVEGLPLIGLPPLRLSRSSRLLKRATDLALDDCRARRPRTVFALLALLIKLDSPGPVFFRQVRMGAAGRTFRIFKFRSMHADAEERKHEFAHLNRHLAPGGDPRMFKIVGDPRVTRVGRLLRRFSSRRAAAASQRRSSGEMSLVGPRPLILDEDQHVERLGTPAAEPQARGDGSLAGARPERDPVRGDGPLDYLYVTRWSLMGDLRLMALTIPALCRRATAD